MQRFAAAFRLPFDQRFHQRYNVSTVQPGDAPPAWFAIGSPGSGSVLTLYSDDGTVYGIIIQAPLDPEMTLADLDESIAQQLGRSAKITSSEPISLNDGTAAHVLMLDSSAYNLRMKLVATARGSRAFVVLLAAAASDFEDKLAQIDEIVYGLHLDDPRLDPILDKCADWGLPVNIHVGEDRWMYEPMDRNNDGLMNAFQWRIRNAPGILRHDEVIATLDRAVKKHPRTTFIACHFANCCYDLSILDRMFQAYPNLYADISARFGETAPIPRYMAKFYETFQDRLLYGTDMGFDMDMYRTTFRILETADEHFYAPLFGYHWSYSGFALPDRVLKKIYHDNAMRVLKK